MRCAAAVARDGPVALPKLAGLFFAADLPHLVAPDHPAADHLVVESVAVVAHQGLDHGRERVAPRAEGVVDIDQPGTERRGAHAAVHLGAQHHEVPLAVPEDGVDLVGIPGCDGRLS